MMRLHWFYAAHDQDTSLIYAKKEAPAAQAKGKGKAAKSKAAEGKGKAAKAAKGKGKSEGSDGDGGDEADEAAPVDKKGKQAYCMGECVGGGVLVVGRWVVVECGCMAGGCALHTLPSVAGACRPLHALNVLLAGPGQ